MTDPLTKDYRGVPDDELVVTFMDDLRMRIAELERREALLTAFVAADDAWTLIDQVRGMADSQPRSEDEWMTALDKREAARFALTEAGFPW